MSEVEIIMDGGRRRRWSSAEKLRIVEETLDGSQSISAVARRNGVAPNLLYHWRKLMLEGGSVAVTGDVAGLVDRREAMSIESLPALRPARAPWNKGRIIGQKRPHQPKHVWSIRVRLETGDNRRDLAPFNMAVDSELRGCDLVRLKVNEVYTAGRVKERASVTQRKTRKPVRFEITHTTLVSLERWIKDPEMIGCEYLWPSRLDANPHLSTRQYARIMRDWVLSIGLEPSAYGTHSMRRTKVAQIYKKTGNLRAVQLLLGHTKMDSTVRYLGVDLDDALSLSEGIDV